MKSYPFINARPGLDVAVVDILPSLARPIEPCTTFHKLAREYAPGAQPSAAVCLVAAAVAAAARCSGCVSVALGSMFITPQPLSAAEMLALLCCEIEQQLRGKLGQAVDGMGGRSLQIFSHAAGKSGDSTSRQGRAVARVRVTRAASCVVGHAEDHVADVCAAFWRVKLTASGRYCGRNTHRPLVF
jgi:hypothetical protein